MKPIARLLPLALATLLAGAWLAARPPSPGPLAAPDPDAAALLPLADQAAELARATIGEPVLREVSTDLTLTTFQFTDRTATVEFAVIVASPGDPPERWATRTTSDSKLTGHPSDGLRLAEVRAGPGRAAQVIADQWPGCGLRSLILYGEGDMATWTAFCDTPDGVVTGEIDARTGHFTPSAAPPARPPSTATLAP
jgi:hypothetical protein